MKRMPWLALWLVAACASSRGQGAQASAGVGSAHEPPVIIYRVRDPDSPHPTIRIPYDTAYQLGVAESSLASPEMLDRLEASCAQSNQPVQCRRELRVCREKTCRVVPVY